LNGESSCLVLHLFLASYFRIFHLLRNQRPDEPWRNAIRQSDGQATDCINIYAIHNLYLPLIWISNPGLIFRYCIIHTHDSHVETLSSRCWAGAAASSATWKVENGSL
jgi:hypothetical protein